MVKVAIQMEIPDTGIASLLELNFYLSTSINFTLISVAAYTMRIVK